MAFKDLFKFNKGKTTFVFIGGKGGVGKPLSQQLQPCGSPGRVKNSHHIHRPRPLPVRLF